MVSQGQGTLVYAPSVEAYVSTANGVLDLSNDIISGEVVRIVDGLSTFKLEINNKRQKYTGKIGRMDRVVIFLNRLKRMQVMSGYASVVPAYDLFPTTTTITGTCTLKRLMYTYWNPMLPDSAALLASTNLPTFDQMTNDMGIAATLHGLLIKVGGWDPSAIHIQNIPESWLQFAKSNAHLANKEETLAALRTALGFDASSNPSASTDTTATDALGVKPGTDGGISVGDTALVARDVGFTGADLVIAVAIAGAESGYNATIFSKPNSNGTIDRGLWQINSCHTQYADADMKDPVKNGQAAFQIYKDGGGWSPWSTFNNGAYNSHMSEAQTAVDKLPAPGTKSTTTTTDKVGGTTGNTTTGATATGSQSSTTGKASVTDSTTSGTTKGTGVTATTPKDSADRVLEAANSQIGKPYIWASPSDPNEKDPAGFDCSGLAMWCYAKAGIKIDHQTNAQYGAMSHTPLSKLNPGDLVFYGSESDTHHVAIYVGNNQVIEAYETGKPVRLRTLSTPITSDEGDILASGGVFSGSPATGAVTIDGKGTGAGTAGGGTPDAMLSTVFNALFLVPEIQILGTDTAYGGELSLINAEQLLTTTTSLCKAGLRSFMSGPNGDFIAFYPDYFGIQNNRTKYRLEDIEMKNVSIQASDDPIATHVFTAGDNLGTFGPVTEADWLNTSGVVTVEQKLVFENLLGIKGDPNYTPAAIYKRFGARPLKAEFPSIRSGVFEYFQALHLFMRSWAQQYATAIDITFMPEVFPGMRMELGNRGIAVYVEQVTHQFSYTDGFATQLIVSSPSRCDGAIGIPLTISGV